MQQNLVNRAAPKQQDLTPCYGLCGHCLAGCGLGPKVLFPLFKFKSLGLSLIIRDSLSFSKSLDSSINLPSALFPSKLYIPHFFLLHCIQVCPAFSKRVFASRSGKNTRPVAITWVILEVSLTTLTNNSKGAFSCLALFLVRQPLAMHMDSCRILYV